MKKRTQGILIVTLIFSLAFNLAFVGIWGHHVFYVRPLLEEQRAPRDRSRAVDYPLLERLEQLDLRPRQRAAIRAHQATLRPRLQEALAQLQETRGELVVLMEDPAAEQEALREAARKVAKCQHRVRETAVEGLLKVRGVLNEEQRRRLGRLLERRHGMGRRMRGRGPHGGAEGMMPHGPHHRRPRGEETGESEDSL